MKWFINDKEKLFNLFYFKTLRCTKSKIGLFEIRGIDQNEKEIIMFSSDSESDRDLKFNRVVRELCYYIPKD